MHFSNILGGIVYWEIIHHSISSINDQLVEQVVDTAYDSKLTMNQMVIREVLLIWRPVS